MSDTTSKCRHCKTRPPALDHMPCCSSHGRDQCCLCYRRSHFVEGTACCHQGYVDWVLGLWKRDEENGLEPGQLVWDRDNRGHFSFSIVCNDVFGPCADTEPIEWGDLGALVRAVEDCRDADYGDCSMAPVLFVARKRQRRPWHLDEWAGSQQVIDLFTAIPVPCPEGFHWIGQPWRSCDKCGLPAWRHKGQAVSPAGSGPFSKEPLICQPWNTSMLAAFELLQKENARG